MDELVYLHELDSARTEDAEVIAGQNALFSALVLDGNIVVMTYNQITDSRAFLDALADQESYEILLDIIGRGRIRFSQFGSIRTPAQYLQNAFANNGDSSAPPFIHGYLPVSATSENEVLFSEMENAIKYSNPYTLRTFRENLANSSFLEETGLAPNLAEAYIALLTDERLAFLERYFMLVLKMSTNLVSYNPPLVGEFPKLAAIIRLVSENIPDECARNPWPYSPLVLDAVNILSEKTHDETFPANQRSAWDQMLEHCALENEGQREACAMAEAIVDLCYCYSCEFSIANLQSEYSPDALGSLNWNGGFGKAFTDELHSYWYEYKEKGLHSFLEADKCKEYSLDPSRLPDWPLAIRLFDGMEKLAGEHRLSSAEKGAENRDPQERQARQRWDRKVRKSLAKRAAASVAAIILLFAFDFAFELAQDAVDLSILLPPAMASLASALIFFAAVNAINLEERFNVPGFSEAGRSFINALSDRLAIKRYRRRTQDGL